MFVVNHIYIMLFSAVEQTCHIYIFLYVCLSYMLEVPYLLILHHCFKCLVVTWLMLCETAAISAHILCTPYNLAPVYSVSSFPAIYVGCIHMFSHLHFGRMTGIFDMLVQVDHGEENSPTVLVSPAKEFDTLNSPINKG